MNRRIQIVLYFGHGWWAGGNNHRAGSGMIENASWVVSLAVHTLVYQLMGGK